MAPTFHPTLPRECLKAISLFLGTLQGSGERERKRERREEERKGHKNEKKERGQKRRKKKGEEEREG